MMNSQETTPTYTPEELDNIRQAIKDYCGLSNIIDRLFQMKDDLEDIEEKLDYYLAPFFARLYTPGASLEHVIALLKVIDEHDGSGLTEVDLNLLRTRIKEIYECDLKGRGVHHE